MLQAYIIHIYDSNGKVVLIMTSRENDDFAAFSIATRMCRSGDTVQVFRDSARIMPLQPHEVAQ